MKRKQTQSELYSSIKPGYYDQIFRRRRGIQSKWHWLKFTHIAALLGNYAALLDVGCGPGSFISLLDPEKTAVGIDLDPGQIAYANKTYGTKKHCFLRQKAEARFPFKDESFDVITIIEVIEHITRDQAFRMLNEARRVLKPGGRVILSTPNYAGLWPVLELIVNKVSSVSYEEQHISHYTPGKLEAFLSSFGYKVEKLYAYQFLSFIVAAFSWDMADQWNTMESRHLSKFFGFLIMAQIRKF
jgi:2-polyprenyl-3-methyl-5-hydroxy-6-metoxy-1,4-benzoquinol methylase